MLRRVFSYLLLAAIGYQSHSLYGNELVKEETIKEFKAATSIYKLNNQIPVAYRSIENSDLTYVHFSIASGMRDFALADQLAASLGASLMMRGSDDYSKEEIFATVEKYSLEIGCSTQIETTRCHVGSVNEYLDTALKLLASLVLEPSFEKKDFEVLQERMLAGTKDLLSDSEAIASDAADQLMYPKGHPLLQTIADTLEFVPKVEISQIKTWHKSILNSAKFRIGAAGSLPPKEFIKKLNQYFGSIPETEFQRATVPEPEYDPEKTYSFTPKKIPTAYIDIRFNAPASKTVDTTGFSFLTDVLSDILTEEVRAKRALTYAINASFQTGQIGEGSITASTSKPKETLETIVKVIKRFRTEEFKRTDLEERKTTFVTGYFLNQEDHSSIASGLVTNLYWYNDPNRMYDFTKRLNTVSSRDIKELAKKWLKNFRIAVVYDRAKFKDEWATEFIKQTQSTRIRKAKK